MADKRMFAKTIVDSDAFLTMPTSAQALYFHIGMNADDDGFVNSPVKITRMIGASDKDLQELIKRKFLYIFDSGIVVVKHWKINNTIREDRKKDTAYPEEMAMLTTKENGSYKLKSDSCQTVDGQLTDSCQTIDGQLTDKRQANARLDKYSIDKYSIDKSSIEEDRKGAALTYDRIKEMYHTICPSLPEVIADTIGLMNLANDRMAQYSVKDFETLFEKAEASAFLKGDNPRGWTANLEWLLIDKNMASTLNGKYDKKTLSTGKAKNKAEQEFDDMQDMLVEWVNERTAEQEATGT